MVKKPIEDVPKTKPERMNAWKRPTKATDRDKLRRDRVMYARSVML